MPVWRCFRMVSTELELSLPGSRHGVLALRCFLGFRGDLLELADSDLPYAWIVLTLHWA